MKLKRLAINDLAEELSQCQRCLVAQSKGLCNSATLTWEGELDLRVRVQNELTRSISTYYKYREATWVCSLESTAQLMTIRTLSGQKLEFLRGGNSRRPGNNRIGPLCL